MDCPLYKKPYIFSNETKVYFLREFVKRGKTCYRCGQPANTKEHMPPKSFFPKGGNLQLKTVPSCKEHNNDKSGDDQYLLAHICMNAGSGQNLPKQIFMRSVAPYLQKSEKFRKSLADGSIGLPNCARRYIVGNARLDNFFDHLSYAVYFDRYGIPLDEQKHKIGHCYLSLQTEDSLELSQREFLSSALGTFYRTFQEVVSRYQADKLVESVYKNIIVHPAGKEASITIVHTFYGIFDVVSLLSRK